MPTRIAVIGAGLIGRKHLGILKDDPAFDTVAARLLLKTIYKRVLGDYESHDELVELHTSRFRGYIERGVSETLLDGRFTTAFDLDRMRADRQNGKQYGPPDQHIQDETGKPVHTRST